MASKSPRIRKLNESVREALAEALERDVSDPRLALVTITSVEVSPDLHHARVFFTAHGDEERYKLALEGLESAKRRLRQGVAKRVSMKYLPELAFHIDASVDEGMRVAEAVRKERETRPVHDEEPQGEDE
jgi:ribosome-binding factor A